MWEAHDGAMTYRLLRITLFIISTCTSFSSAMIAPAWSAAWSNDQRALDSSLSPGLVFTPQPLAQPPPWTANGKCLLRVDGVNYIDGPCDIDIVSNGFGPGTFQITGPNGLGAFVEVYKKDHGQVTWLIEKGEGYSNGSQGLLRRDGGCWINDEAKICAWK